MGKINTIKAVIEAYKTCWAARQYIVRLAAAPLFIKFVCLMFATSMTRSLGISDSGIILFVLIMIPAYLAEGWMLAH
ncbi:MAG: hypothetical protein DI551_06110, partial [Micavibrio aeruginosavorus]